MVRPIQWKMCLGPKEKCPPYEFYRFQRHTPKSRWLMAQRVFHGLDPITPELKEVIYACTNCLMCQELCGVRDDGYGPWDITVAMREEITEKEGPIEPHRPIYEGLRQHDNPWAQPKDDAGRLGRGAWAQETGRVQRAHLAFCRLFGGSCERPGRRASRSPSIMQKAGEDFVILGDEEKCCGLYAFDLGFRREYERLKEDNLATIANGGITTVVVACGSCQRIWREYAKTGAGEFEALHGVEYVARAARVGPTKIYQADKEESHLSRLLPSRPRLRRLRGAAKNSCARFPAFSWSRWNAIDAGAGAAAAVAECPKRIPSWRSGTPRIACVKPRPPARKSCSPRARSASGLSLISKNLHCRSQDLLEFIDQAL